MKRIPIVIIYFYFSLLITAGSGELFIKVINKTSGKFRYTITQVGDAWSWDDTKGVYYLTRKFRDSKTANSTVAFDCPKGHEADSDNKVMPWGKMRFTITSLDGNDRPVFYRTFYIDFRDERWSRETAFYPSHDTDIEIDQTNEIMRIRIYRPPLEYTTIRNGSSYKIWTLWGRTGRLTHNFVLPASPLSVSISGQRYLGFKASDTYSANVSGGNGKYSYEWRKRQLGYPVWGDVITTNSSVNLTMNSSDFEIQLKVVSGTETAYATKKVYYLEEQDPLITSDNNNFSVSIESTFTLEQNFPNPFNPSTKIKYSIPQNSFVKIEVYDMLGRSVAKLVNQFLEAGSYSTHFNAEELPSGIYLYSIETGNYFESKKMLLVK